MSCDDLKMVDRSMGKDRTRLCSNKEMVEFISLRAFPHWMVYETNENWHEKY